MGGYNINVTSGGGGLDTTAADPRFVNQLGPIATLAALAADADSVAADDATVRWATDQGQYYIKEPAGTWSPIGGNLPVSASHDFATFPTVPVIGSRYLHTGAEMQIAGLRSGDETVKPGDVLVAWDLNNNAGSFTNLGQAEQYVERLEITGLAEVPVDDIRFLVDRTNVANPIPKLILISGGSPFTFTFDGTQPSEIIAQTIRLSAANATPWRNNTGQTIKLSHLVGYTRPGSGPTGSVGRIALTVDGGTAVNLDIADGADTTGRLEVVTGTPVANQINAPDIPDGAVVLLTVTPGAGDAGEGYSFGMRGVLS